MEETSLDDFLDAETSGEAVDPGGDAEDQVADHAEGGRTADTGAAGESADDTGTPAPEPPQITATWVPTGGTCERCGEDAEWRWNHEGTMVCPHCKAW